MVDQNKQDKTNPQEQVQGFIAQGTLQQVISIPVLAMIEAQKSANADYLQYINRVMLDENGFTKNIEFNYNAVNSGDGGATHRRLSVPLMAIITHPCIGVAETKVDFTLRVSDNLSYEATEESTKTITQSELDAKNGLSNNKSFSLTRSENRKRSTETEATIKFSVMLDRVPISESLQKVVDNLLNNS